jgi:hypothetical protein
MEDGKLGGLLKLLMLACRRKCHCFPCIRPGIPPHSCVYGTKLDTVCDLCLVLEKELRHRRLAPRLKSVLPCNVIRFRGFGITNLFHFQGSG